MEVQFQILDDILTPVSVLALDAQGRPCYVAFNVEGRKVGHFELDDVLGKTAKEAFGEKYGEHLYELHVQAFKSKTPVAHEFPLRLNGRERRISSVLNQVFDVHGTVLYIVGCPLDITAEHALRQMEERTAAVNQEMEGFISLAAHDLRSPMRRVNDIASFLREDLPELSESNNKLLGMLENVASKSFEMISDLISHAQASEIAGQQDTYEPYRLKSICEQVLQTLDPAQFHHWEVADALIVGERLPVQIIIRNLIDNAIKHNTDKKLKVSVAASRVDDQQFEIVVRDNGKGFSAAGIAHLQGDKLTTGSGFGLAGVLRLVASRGGVITADEPVKGAGATVRVTMPGSLSS